MTRGRAVAAKKGHDSGDSVYTLEQLPDENKKRYHSLLEDFDKQVEAHIEEARAEMEKLMKQIKTAYQIELFKLPKEQRELNQEELVLKNIEEKQKKNENPIRESSIFQSNLDKVSKNIDNQVTNQVAKIEISTKKRGRGGNSTVKKSKKKRSFSEPPPPTELRRSTRKRIPSERTFLAMETPHAGPGLAKGPLTSTAYSNRTRRIGKNATVMQTPCGANYSSANPFTFADVSNVLPMVTPKFNMATPLNKQFTVMRAAKQNETIISLGGSPIYMGQTARKNGRKKVTAPTSPADHVAINIGDGRKLMVPTNDEVDADENAQPLDLDEEAFKRLKRMRDHLENILKQAGNH